VKPEPSVIVAETDRGFDVLLPKNCDESTKTNLRETYAELLTKLGVKLDEIYAKKDRS
jgi:hypothetical protein